MADPSRPTAPSAASTSTSSSASSPANDWPAQVTDTVVGLVDNAKGKIEGPANSTARGVVYGTLGAIVGTAVLVIALVMLFRATDVLVNFLLDLAGIEEPGRSVWIAHLLWGAGFALFGAYCLKKGRRPAPAV